MEAEPESPEPAARWLAAQARYEGPAVWRACLTHPDRWTAAPVGLREAVVARLARELDETLRFETWTRLECLADQGLVTGPDGVARAAERVDIGATMASFRHRRSGEEMVLIPGFTPGPGRLPMDAVEPFLLSRHARVDITGRPVVGRPLAVVEAELDELGLRLPSPAEWSHACRGGTVTRYFWGQEFRQEFVQPLAEVEMDLPMLDGEVGPADPTREARPRPARGPSPPGPHTANPFGLLDMIGNVWEWVSGRPDQCMGGNVGDSVHVALAATGPWSGLASAAGCRPACSLPPLAGADGDPALP